MTAHDPREGVRVGKAPPRSPGYVQGFVAGVLVSIPLVLVACATGGAGSTSGAEGVAPPAATAADPAPATDPATGSATAAPDAGVAGSPVAEYLADAQAMGRAHQLFRAVCTGYCHSTQPAADRVAPNLFDCEWDHGSTDEEIFQSIAIGIP
ncbi:MAG TPA: hypothetical protein VMS86_07335, partial [Thermoanaerobaculia bacterium]|nr:hypothetical protein [Thermoanaerobaculia bacterium]